MIRSTHAAAFLSLALLASAPLSVSWADDAAKPDAANDDSTKQAGATSAVSGDSSSSDAAKAAAGTAAAKPKSKYPPHATVLKDTKPQSGLFKLHQSDTKLFAELTSANLNKDYIVLISIAKGIGRSPLLGGMSWGFGDDWVWQFRKAGDRILIVRRNVRFTAKNGSPADKAVKLAYTDSVLFSLPIATMGPSGGYVIDLTPVFMSDLPQISQVLRGFVFSPSKSLWASTKAFKDNIELQVAATYASSGASELESVADSRGVTINVHYSISALPSTGYKPRLADDRVGYFLTVLKDYSKKDDSDRFLRYINRWDLQKADASAKLSPPKKPIVFWIEKTVPFEHRKAVREGIEEWNKAFEKAGFVNAIEVRQQPDDAEWDPEDINYNTFRWITSSAGFAMGPSRVNPTTGQILDADIIFDADFLQFWKREYETLTPKSIAAMTGGPLDLESYHESMRAHAHNPLAAHAHCDLCQSQSRQLALGASVIAARKQSPEELDKLIGQALKDVTMHEVGHTLGLRHNFKASTLYSLEEVNDVSKTSKTGLTASVMDYTPANLVPKDMKQGDFYSTTIGPYDYWAIEYGYSPVAGGSPEGELPALQKIAARSGEPELAYSTDEDTRGIDPDPNSNRFDLGKDSVAYARQQAKLVAEVWPDMLERMTKDGDGYQRARRAINVLLATHGSAMFVAARNVGGLYISRSHKGDKDAAPPMTVVDAKRQREAIKLLEEQVFSDKPFQFPAELYNHLAPSFWSHWGESPLDRKDFPAHAVIAMWQDRILAQLLSSLTLDRLHDSELRVPADQDAFTTAELLERLTAAIFAETEKLGDGEYTNRKPAISSIRRNLQRSYLKNLSNLAMGRVGGPEDAQTVAYAQLVALEGRLDGVLKGNNKLDTYSRAHLMESASRIRKVIDARLQLLAP
jgi:hypothetical protein